MIGSTVGTVTPPSKPITTLSPWQHGLGGDIDFFNGSQPAEDADSLSQRMNQLGKVQQSYFQQARRKAQGQSGVTYGGMPNSSNPNPLAPA